MSIGETMQTFAKLSEVEPLIESNHADVYKPIDDDQVWSGYG